MRICSICIDLCINKYSCTDVHPITNLALLLGILVTVVNWKGHLSCMNSENLLWGQSLEASAHIAVQVWENNSGIFFFNRDEPEEQNIEPKHLKCSRV